MSYIGFKRDRCYLAYYKSDFKHKFFPILINGNMFIINVDEKIIFCLEEEDKFSEKLCLAVIKHRNNGKTIIVSGMLALLIFFSPVEKVIDIRPIPQASSEIIRKIPRTAQEELVLELRSGGSDISESIIKILLIWTMSRGYTTTNGFQPKPFDSQFNRPGPNPRIAPKLQENPVNRNNLGQGTCRANQNNQDGTLTKEQRRNLPHSDDVEITEQNLTIRHGQAKYKIKNHGSDFGLPSKPNVKGWNKTERTAENIKDFKDKIKDLVLRGERFEGTYRKSEPDGYSAIHFYDAATRQNAIFKQKTKEFVSAWKLTPDQAQDLLQNKNVGDY